MVRSVDHTINHPPPLVHLRYSVYCTVVVIHTDIDYTWHFNQVHAASIPYTVIKRYDNTHPGTSLRCQILTLILIGGTHNENAGVAKIWSTYFRRHIHTSLGVCSHPLPPLPPRYRDNELSKELRHSIHSFGRGDVLYFMLYTYHTVVRYQLPIPDPRMHCCCVVILHIEVTTIVIAFDRPSAHHHHHHQEEEHARFVAEQIPTRHARRKQATPTRHTSPTKHGITASPIPHPASQNKVHRTDARSKHEDRTRTETASLLPLVIMSPPAAAAIGGSGCGMEQSHGNIVDEIIAVDSAKMGFTLKTVGTETLRRNRKRSSVDRTPLVFAGKIPQPAGTTIDLTSDFIGTSHRQGEAGGGSIQVSDTNVSMRGHTKSGNKHSSGR